MAKKRQNKRTAVAEPTRARYPWWLILGLITYLSIAVGSMAQYFTGNLGYDLYAIIDLLASSVLYFFFGGVVGFVIDWVLAKRHNMVQKMPDWASYTIIIYVGGMLLALIAGSPEVPWFIFPLAYGIFFPGFAFITFFPNAITKSIYVKLVLDTIYFVIFCTWLWLAIKWQRGDEKRRAMIIRRTASAIIFLVLVIGMVSCAQHLG